MKNFNKIFFLLFLMILPFKISNAATGDLSVSMISLQSFSGAVPGDTVTYSVFYYWQGDGPASNVELTDNFPSDIDLVSAYPSPTSQTGNELKWQVGSLNSGAMGFVTLTGIIKSTVPFGTTITNTVSISSADIDNNSEDNRVSIDISVQQPVPDMWTFQWGLMETLESGIFFTAEVGVSFNFEIYYANMSFNAASNVVVTDTLSEGVEFVSADPAPSSVTGNVVTWNIGDMKGFDFNQINLKLRPTSLGDKKITAGITCTEPENNTVNNTSVFTFSVVSVIQPTILKPQVKYFGSGNPLMMPSNPVFSGLAKAGAKVTLYEGDSTGAFGDLSYCHPKELGSTIAGTDRKWQITPAGMNQDRTYYLYVQAEYNGDKSAPFMSMWQPMAISINSIFDSAGFDMDHFVIQTGNQEVYPGALGGSSGTVPYEDIIIKKRFKAPPSILIDTTMWKDHEMKVVVTEGGDTFEQMLPVSEVRPVTGNKIVAGPNSLHKTTDYVEYDFIYVQKGFGPGAHVEVWCHPNYYNDEGQLVLSGLTWSLCHEILIDPAGYVYDTDIAGQEYEWPAVPPEKSLIKNATVTAMTRTGDDSWERWRAEDVGQVNPQVTDSTTGDGILTSGYFAFFVQPGQYQVKASAPDYADFVSPILTVVDEPIYYNVGMKRNTQSVTGIKIKNGGKENTNEPQAFELEQNYPNPFNPVTTIGYKLPFAGKVTLKIYNTLGKEVATLLKDEFKEAGHHVLQFNASSLPSGIYFYRLTAGKYSFTKKSVLIK